MLSGNNFKLTPNGTLGTQKNPISNSIIVERQSTDVYEKVKSRKFPVKCCVK